MRLSPRSGGVSNTGRGRRVRSRETTTGASNARKVAHSGLAPSGHTLASVWPKARTAQAPPSKHLCPNESQSPKEKLRIPMTSYYEKLRDPRWQRKRLEVMEASGFSCDECGSTTNTLNVHHGRYVKGRSPWDYPIEELHCLCERCHEFIHETREYLDDYIGRMTLPQLVVVMYELKRLWGLENFGEVTSDDLFEKFPHLDRALPVPESTTKPR